jgi:hypothetical protein
VAGNTEHIAALSRMGIKLVTMNDGRVQLLHVSSEVGVSVACFQCPAKYLSDHFYCFS